MALIDKQAGVRVSTSDLASAERRGLLWLLDEEAIFPGATGNKRNWNSAYNREMTNWPLVNKKKDVNLGQKSWKLNLTRLFSSD